MKHPIQQSLILIFILFLTGCAEMTKYTETIKPTAKLTDTRLTNINFEQADLVFDMAVENQNPIAINLAGLNYDLKIENQSLVSGVTAQGLEIKPASTSAVQLPVTLKFDDLRKLPGELQQKDSFSYQLDTEIFVDLPLIGHYAIPVTKRGELPVPKLPDMKIKDVQIKNLSFAAAELVALVEIVNPNAFELGFSNFNYQLNVNQQSWGQGSINKSKSIAENGKATIEIPLKLNMVSMGQTAYKMLANKQPLEYQLKGGISLDTGIELLRNYNMPIDIKGKAPLN